MFAWYIGYKEIQRQLEILSYQWRAADPEDKAEIRTKYKRLRQDCVIHWATASDLDLGEACQAAKDSKDKCEQGWTLEKMKTLRSRYLKQIPKYRIQ